MLLSFPHVVLLCFISTLLNMFTPKHPVVIESLNFLFSVLIGIMGPNQKGKNMVKAYPTIHNTIRENIMCKLDTRCNHATSFRKYI
jgi:hypothetical protein